MESVSALLRSEQVRSSKKKPNLSVCVFPIGALPYPQPPGSLGLDPLREEPATTELDWSFAPRPKSEERIARQNPCGPPPGFRPASTCSGLDRSVSGSHRGDYTGTHRTLLLSKTFITFNIHSYLQYRIMKRYWMRAIGFPTHSRLTLLSLPPQ